MTPGQFRNQLERHGPSAVYLFLGPEAYQKQICRKELLEHTLPEEEREAGLIRHDLDEVSLHAVIDDALSLSLFAPRRLIWVSSAESALPRGKAAGEEHSQSAVSAREDPSAALAAYCKDPSPGTVLVFEASRYGFEGEDKARLERVKKFYSAVPGHVEFRNYSDAEAHHLAQELAQSSGLRLDHEAAVALVEAVGAEAVRIAAEIEKLRLYAGAGAEITTEMIATMVPNARATTIFALVAALGRGDRKSALDLLDTLVREGEYLPLALTFLDTQFRQALAAKEQGLRTAEQIQAHFSRLGVPMWPSRARQVHQTLAAFSKDRLEGAIRKIYSVDKALRDTRPDDRTVMEAFVLSVTS
jgi:DNA polymerase-3 subunit delta